MEKLSFMEITDMNQLLLSKYLCDFNQMLGNVKCFFSSLNFHGSNFAFLKIGRT